MRMPDHQDASDLEGRTLGKKFMVRRLIGEGGMGAVYEVEHVVTKRRGALKLLHKSFASSGDIAERFLLEASAAGRIGNPHIVETFDAGELPDGEPYIFMELLSGRPLRELLLEQGRIPFGEARELVIQVANGLAAAHQAGIVHRDIKPDNLFLCAGSTPFVKILDFGISKFTEQHNVKRLTEQGATLGTPHYMSPEQVVSKRDIDGRVDVYALGVVLYECLSGRVPFDAESLPALSIKIFEGEYTPVSELVPNAPHGLDSLLKRALAREPSRRFGSVLALRDALEELQAPSAPFATRASAVHGVLAVSEPPPSTSPGVVSSSGRTEKRSQRVLLASLLAVLGLAGGVAAALRGPPIQLESAGLPSAAHASGSPRADSPSTPDASARAAGGSSSATGLSSATAATSATAAAIPSARARQIIRAAPSVGVPPRSRAAADGLSERNPFAD